jgi:hypothetical protein
MNKKQFIKQEIEKNKLAFGRWHSTIKRNSADPVKLLFESPPRNEEEVLQHGNALANTGNYPVGTSECFNVGISGGCDPECFVYLKGECGEPQEMIPRLQTKEERQQYIELYGG